MKEKAIDWLKVAETDILVAEILVDHEHLAPSISFHLYTDSRYPGEFGLMPDGAPTRTEIRDIVQATKGLYLEVKESLS